jgi:hypothetical protein
MLQSNQSDLLFPEMRYADAVLSADGLYRYKLTRKWSDKGLKIAFVCLNPSTADAETDDQTVRKCVRFAKKWGGSELIIGNLFAFRSTDPAALRSCVDPIGPENDYWLSEIAKSADILVAAWGTHGTLGGRNLVVQNKYVETLSVLKVTKGGHPSHPLYLQESLTPFLFSPTPVLL